MLQEEERGPWKRGYYASFKLIQPTKYELSNTAKRTKQYLAKKIHG